MQDSGALIIRARDLRVRRGGKEILSNVGIQCQAGTVTAIIGPSGSGKSTLLKSLATLIQPDQGTISWGHDQVNDIKRDFRRQFAYLPQDDAVHVELTIDQALDYAARLRLPASISDSERKQRIEHLSERLGLRESHQRRIRKLSGGQRKRVAIAIELLAEPSLLLLDEPASGLDPGTELALVELLRDLAGQDKTVVMTTHSMACLGHCDQLVLLHQGHLVYCGDLSGMLSHFGIDQVAEVYLQLQRQPAEVWARQWRSPHG